MEIAGKSKYDINPAKSTPVKGAGKDKAKKKGNERSFAKKLGIFLTIVQAILSGTFLWTLFQLNLLPMKYLAAVVFLVVALFFITFATQKRHKGRASYGKTVAIVMIIVLGIGSFYSNKKYQCPKQ